MIYISLNSAHNFPWDLVKTKKKFFSPSGSLYAKRITFLFLDTSIEDNKNAHFLKSESEFKFTWNYILRIGSNYILRIGSWLSAIQIGRYT